MDSKFVPFQQYLGHQMSPKLFLSLAVKIATIVSRFHQDGVVLGNLNPNILLISRQDDTVHLADFSRDTVPDINSKKIFYLAPEQTGRLNRTADVRTDLFSLGVIFYEMLTGRLPIEGNNELEWFHNLMAKDIKPPRQVDRHIPAVLSHIVMKCLHRDPDDRYQSAEGVKRDLLRCLEEWEEHGELTLFEIGRHDVPAFFSLSDDFYGRERELLLLQESFSKASQGQTEIVFVTGPAGIGKSRLIRQFSEQVRKKQGFFISGKFKPLLNEAPFAGLTMDGCFLTMQQALYA